MALCEDLLSVNLTKPVSLPLIPW